MSFPSRLIAALSGPTLVLACAFTSSPSSKGVPVVVTAAPEYNALAALNGGERFPRGAQLLRVSGAAVKPLVPAFAASADASVSFDARHVLFAGKKLAGDRWSIWELSVADGSTRFIVGAADADYIRPLYLPGDTLVYARSTPAGFRMEVANVDGSSQTPLTFVRGSAIPQDVLADGRILFQATYPLGTDVSPGAVSELYLTYSDGSGVEAYRCDHGTPRWGGKQLASGDVLFTKGATLARFTSPLATEALVSAPAATYDGGMAELPNGALLLGVRKSNSHFALVRWRQGQPAFIPVLAQADHDLVNPVLLIPRNRPRVHPSALHDWQYANMLALDVRQSREGDLESAPSTVRLEAQDANGKPVQMGSAPIETDGSFFLKVPADTPLRFAMLDAKGAVVRQEHGWFWIRKGEQRICVGCHAGPERASENRVPAVLLRSTTPTDLSAMPNTAAAHTAQGSR